MLEAWSRTRDGTRKLSANFTVAEFACKDGSDPAQSQPWVTDDGSSEKLTLDGAVTEYLETGKKIYDGGYSNNTALWDSSWAADILR